MISGYRAAAENARSYIAATSIVTRTAVTSVLICDDRPDFRQCFASMLNPGLSGIQVRGVSDAFSLVDAYAERPADLILIGIHAGSTAGQEAVALLLGMYPDTKIIVVGSITDLPLLVECYVRGTTGLLPWDHD